MSIDIFGRQLAAGRETVGARGPPGIGFKTTEDDQYDMDGRRLCNIAEPQQLSDAVSMNTLVTTIKREIDDLQSALEQIGAAHEKGIRDDLQYWHSAFDFKVNEDMRQRSTLDEAILGAVNNISQFMKKLDIRLALLERDKTDKSEVLAQQETRALMRGENTRIVNQLQTMIHARSQKSTKL